MDFKTVALLLGANLLAIALLLSRLDKQGLISLDKHVPYQLLGEPCGLARHDVLALTSSRIVFSSGVSPGAGTIRFNHNFCSFPFSDYVHIALQSLLMVAPLPRSLGSRQDSHLNSVGRK